MKIATSVVAMILAALCLVPPSASADTTKATYESLTKMLKEAGYTSEVHPEISGHLLKFQGKGIGEFTVGAIADDEMIALLSYVARPGKVEVTPQLMANLNEVNANLSLVKLVIDNKGNLVFAYYIYESMIDAKDLKKLLDIITASTIHFYNNTNWIKK